MKKVVIGNRTNFIKVAQFKKLVANYTLLDLKIVNTGVKKIL